MSEQTVALRSAADPRIQTDETHLDIQASALYYAADLASVHVHVDERAILLDIAPARGRAACAATAVRAFKIHLRAHLADAHPSVRVAGLRCPSRSPLWWATSPADGARVLRCGLVLGGAS